MPPEPPSVPDPDESGREIEWQLAAEDLAPVRRWLIAHPGVAGLDIVPAHPQRLQDTYLDTDDWRVFRAGFALRVRERDTEWEATLKSLHSARTDLADRQEMTEALSDGPPALARACGPVGVRVREMIGTAPLRRLFRAETRRERFRVRRPGQAHDAAEIALDETSLLASDGTHLEHLRRVEVEAVGGPLEPLAALVEVLRIACGLRRPTENKFAAGLRAAGRAAPRA